MMTTLASKAVARAMATAWRWPPESSSTRWATLLTWMCSLSRCSIARARLALWSTSVNGPIAPRQLAAEEDVLVDAQVAGQREVLVDHLDAQAARIARGCRGARGRPSTSDLARARRMEAGEASSSASTCRRRCRRRRPAPRPGRAPGSTSLRATTWPKCLEMPRASMTGTRAPAGCASSAGPGTAAVTRRSPRAGRPGARSPRPSGPPRCAAPPRRRGPCRGWARWPRATSRNAISSSR